MDDFIKAMEGLLDSSKQTYQNWPFKQKPSQNWQKCWDLLRSGWKMKDYSNIENSDDILVVWTKDNQEQEIRLTYKDQIIWLEILQHGENK